MATFICVDMVVWGYSVVADRYLELGVCVDAIDSGSDVGTAASRPIQMP